MCVPDQDSLVSRWIQQQQQGRALSLYNDDESMNPRFGVTNLDRPSNLNRAVSLPCETGPSSATERLLTIIPLFGCDMKSLEQLTRLGLILPPVIESAIEHILAKGINSIGIFRKSGVRSRILTLRQRIESNQSLTFDEINQNNEFSIYDIADLVKMWFRELKPLPLMTKELIKLISTLLSENNLQSATTTTITSTTRAASPGETSSSQQTILGITTTTTTSNQLGRDNPELRKRIDSLVTPTHKALLFRALNFFAQISTECEANQMTSQNLAICLTPSLCATESDQDSVLSAQKALEFSIDNHARLFE